MANNYSAQGSITIKRLRNGDSLFLTLETNGIPLYQGVDPSSGTVNPDWTIAANQPVITPKATSVRGNAVALSGHNWYYNQNQTPLVFNGTASDGWVTDSTGKFQLNLATGALKIVGNLASAQNTANDSLVYKGVATVGGIEYGVEKSIDILIQPFGSSSYVGFVTATTEQLTSSVQETTLTTKLLCGADELTSYHVRWYKDDTEWSAKNGQKSITVGRDDVDGTQLFIAEFYKQSSDAAPVYRAGIRIIDTLDDFQVVCYISSANKEVAPGKDVEVAAKIVNQRTHAEVSPASPAWRMDVMKKSDWAVVKTSNRNTITVTTEETDADGQENDVEVTAEVTWSE